MRRLGLPERRDSMLERWSFRLVLAAVAACAALVVAGPASADTTQDYIDCMNRAITHKDAMIAAGVPYREAMEDYYAHTRGCYSWYYLGGDHYIPCDAPWFFPCPVIDGSGGGGGGYGWIDPWGSDGGGGGGWWPGDPWNSWFGSIDPFDALLAQVYGY
jgi:hypothetical protein